jgi:CCR4-NOT transcription complex subunit 1
LDRTRLAFARLDAACASDPAASFALLPETHEARAAVAELVAAAAANQRAGADDAARVAVAQKVFQRAYEPPPGRSSGSPAASLTARRLRRTAHAAALAALCQRSRAAARQVAGWLVYAEDDRALDAAFCESLVRAGCLADPEAMRELDAHLASVIAGNPNDGNESGTNVRVSKAAACGAYLAQHCLLVDPCLSVGDLEATLDALAAYASAAAAPPGVAALVDRARARGGSEKAQAQTERKGSGTDKDPAGMREQVAKHFDEWARVSELPSGDGAVETFLASLAKSNLTREENRERFARILVELAVTHCLGSETPKADTKSVSGVSEQSRLSFVAVDAFVRLIASLCRRAEEPAEKRPALLAAALVAAARTATRDVDERGAAFNPRPYHRLVLGLMVEMHAPGHRAGRVAPAGARLVRGSAFGASAVARAWFRVRLARARVAPLLLTASARRPRKSGVAFTQTFTGRRAGVFGAVPARLSADGDGAFAVPRHAASSPGAPARLPRVSVRPPPGSVRRHTAQLRADAQPGAQRVSKSHAPA